MITATFAIWGCRSAVGTGLEDGRFVCCWVVQELGGGARTGAGPGSAGQEGGWVVRGEGLGAEGDEVGVVGGGEGVDGFGGGEAAEAVGEGGEEQEAAGGGEGGRARGGGMRMAARARAGRTVAEGRPESAWAGWGGRWRSSRSRNCFAMGDWEAADGGGGRGAQGAGGVVAVEDGAAGAVVGAEEGSFGYSASCTNAGD